ncbi:phosphatase PAP2 family protein [Methylorubrum populi]
MKPPSIGVGVGEAIPRRDLAGRPGALKCHGSNLAVKRETSNPSDKGAWYRGDPGSIPQGVTNALRDGSLRAVPLEEVGPVISFPSLHCAVAYLVTAALWPLGTLRWVTLLLNGVMTLSAVTHGAHYASDCIAGLFVAAVSFRTAGWLGPWSERRLAGLRGAATLPATDVV